MKEEGQRPKGRGKGKGRGEGEGSGAAPRLRKGSTRRAESPLPAHRRQPVPPTRFDPRLRGQGTRERLIRATLECLAKGGPPAATSREITRKARSNLQAITYHFGSKDDLVSEALLRALHTWIDPARQVLMSERDPVSKMIGAVQALQDSFERASEILPVYLEALTRSRSTGRLRAGVRRLLADVHRLLAEQIAELRATGFLPAWIEPNAMATLLLSAADGLALHAVIGATPVDHHAVAAQVMQLLLAARTPPGGAPTPP